MRLLLIAEDDADTRTTLTALLSDIGYSVCGAPDAPSALDELKSLHPDLVLLDYGLPGIKGGDEFMNAKVRDPEIASIPVVVVSGYNLPSSIQGCVAVMRKPFELDTLLAVIAAVVGPPEKPHSAAA
jgi:CheY-like chemotaxis protein